MQLLATVSAADPLSFELFVRVLEELARVGALGHSNEHWAPQAELCGLHSLQFDFVGQVRAGRGEQASVGACNSVWGHAGACV